MVRGAAFVLPLVAVGLLILAFALGDRRARVLSLIALLGGAAMTAHAIPRADETHVVAGSVGSIFAIGIAAGLLRQRVTARSVRLAIASVGGIAFVVLAAGAVSQLRLGDRGVAHAKGIGVPLGPGELDALARLRDATNGTVFVFSPDAAHVYLYGGLQNPTPYDFPIRTAFGGQGERDVAEAVRAGHLSVCVGFSYGPPLAPTEIDAAIAETRVPIGDYRPVCILQAPVASPP
jgi:hypothetical protein